MNDYESGYDQNKTQLIKLKSDKNKAEKKIEDLEERIRKDKKKMKNVDDALYNAQQEVSDG